MTARAASERGYSPKLASDSPALTSRSGHAKAPRVRWNSQLVVVCLGYFVQGSKTQMALLAERYIMKDLLGFDPARCETWIALSKAPWMIKPLWGFISDVFPIFGQHRRPYLCLCGLLGCAGYLGMSLLGFQGAALMLGFMTISELSIAVSDVVVDGACCADANQFPEQYAGSQLQSMSAGIVVEQARGEPQETAGTLQSLCWGSEAVGSLASAVVVGPAIARLGPRSVIFGMAFLPLGVGAAAYVMHEARTLPGIKASMSDAEELHLQASGVAKPQEPPDEDWASRRSPAQQSARSWAEVASKLATLGRALIMPSVLLPALYIFLSEGHAGLTSAIFFFYTVHLGFQPQFMGVLQFVSGLSLLAGVLIFNIFLKQIPLRRLLFMATLLTTSVSLTQLVLVTGLNRKMGLDDKLFALLDEGIVAAAGRASYMPIYVLAARVCPVGVEASLYAGLMSVGNLGQGSAGAYISILSRLVGVTSTQFGNTWILILASQVGNWLSLLLLPWLPGGPEPQQPAPELKTHFSEASADSPPSSRTGELDRPAEVEMLQGAVGLAVRHHAEQERAGLLAHP